jgi:acyl-CoA synthetase (NDP forming)
MQPLKRSDLDSFFYPDSVAVIGSLKDGMGLGYRAIRNMLHFGYPGKIYPVNPAYSEVLNMKAYSTVDEIPEAADLAIVITPPPTVPEIVQACAGKGVKGVVVVSENFAEAGQEGAGLQRELVEIRQRTGMRIMGPNTIGLLNTANGFTTVPYFIAYDSVRKGTISFCSQSGFVGPTAQALEDHGFPIAKMCDVGNKCDVNEVDLLDYLAGDRECNVVAMHLEDVKDGRAFIAAARNCVARKPLIVLKSGRTEAGARASASHTGSLVGNDQVHDMALRQAGATRVSTWREFWETPKMLALQPLPAGDRIAIVTHTGGAGVVAADAAIESGLKLSRLSDSTLEKLAGWSPRLCHNPIDLGPLLSIADDPFGVQEESIAAVLDDPNVDCAMVTSYGGIDGLTPLNVRMFEGLKKRISKPVSVWLYGMKLASMEELSRELEALGFPSYMDVEIAVKSLGIAASYARFREGKV